MVLTLSCTSCAKAALSAAEAFSVLASTQNAFGLSTAILTPPVATSTASVL